MTKGQTKYKHQLERWKGTDKPKTTERAEKETEVREIKQNKNRMIQKDLTFEFMLAVNWNREQE